jgi:hypothetical protein
MRTPDLRGSHHGISLAARVVQVTTTEGVTMSENYESYIPVERDGSSGDPRSAVFFMIRGLLSSRVESGISDDDGPSEEDVNVYLSLLLCDFLKPAYHERANQYVSSHDTSVFEQVRNTTDTRLKYTVYKTNADHILMMTGLFQNADGHMPHAVPEPLRIDDDIHLGRGKAYYDFAFTYSRSLFGRTSGIASVLSKLSSRFESYVRLLTYMRIDYLNLIDRMSAGDVYHLKRELFASDVAALRNDFLDSYRIWRDEPTAEHRAQLARAAARLHEADPSFRFEFPEN